MFFLLVSIAVPILLYVAVPPALALAYGPRTVPRTYLALACLAFFISWYLPSPLIDGRDTAFATHFVGGGVFSGLLWCYGRQFKPGPQPWVLEALSLFSITSALGVANELFELAVVRLGVVRLSLTDTSWDLLANTLGAAAFWLVFRLVRAVVVRGGTAKTPADSSLPKS